jgi:hypothetical protein
MIREIRIPTLQDRSAALQKVSSFLSASNTWLFEGSKVSVRWITLCVGLGLGVKALGPIMASKIPIGPSKPIAESARSWDINGGLSQDWAYPPLISQDPGYSDSVVFSPGGVDYQTEARQLRLVAAVTEFWRGRLADPGKSELYMSPQLDLAINLTAFEALMQEAKAQGSEADVANIARMAAVFSDRFAADYATSTVPDENKRLAAVGYWIIAESYRSGSELSIDLPNSRPAGSMNYAIDLDEWMGWVSALDGAGKILDTITADTDHSAERVQSHVNVIPGEQFSALQSLTRSGAHAAWNIAADLHGVLEEAIQTRGDDSPKSWSHF